MAGPNVHETVARSRKTGVLSGAATSRTLLVFAGALFTVGFALAMLTITSAHEGVVFGPDAATRLLAFELLAVSLLLALASSSQKIRLTLQMILIYLTIYLILPGYHHSSANEFPFYGMQYSNDVRLQAAAIISVFVVSLIAGYVLSDRIWVSGRAFKPGIREIIFPNQVLLIIFTIASMVATVVYLATVGLDTAIGTRADFSIEGGAVQAGLLVTVPRTITFVAFAYCYVLLLRARKAGLSLYFTLINAVPFLLTNFPLALSRHGLFGIILFFLVQTINFRSAKSRNLLTAIFVAGALVAMPYIDSLSRHEGATRAQTVAQVYNSYLTSGDFDGLQSIQNAVIYHEMRGQQDGLQLLSAALFFVPRAIWTEKGLPTGELTSRAAGYEFHNISQPLPSEFFVDFGWIGLGLLAFVLGIAVARLDGWIDRNWDNGPRARLVAGVVVAFSIIIMRGSLLGIIPSVVVFVAGISLIIWLGLVRPETLRIRRRRRADDNADLSPRVARHAQTVARRR